MNEFLHLLQLEMTRPTMYGWFHLLCIGLMVAVITLIFVFRKCISPKLANNAILSFGIVAILFEVYKLTVLSFSYNDGINSYWDFPWYSFPFQFCSTPMYVALLAGILRKGKVHDALLCYLATFGLFGGLAVVVFPGDVFTNMIGINIQTMYVHCGMVIIAMLIFATKSIDMNYKSLLKASIVFAIMVPIALLLNVIANKVMPGVTFNMFFISPYFNCTLPLLSMIYPKVPYIVFLFMYIVGFVLCATIMLSIAILINKSANRKPQNA